MNHEENDPKQGTYSEKGNEYKKDQANGNLGDPSAKRNIGPNGNTERKNQKDNLDNLHIFGNETTGYGANDHVNAGENAQGPGFEAEGSEYVNENANMRASAADNPEKGQKETDQPDSPPNQQNV